MSDGPLLHIAGSEPASLRAIGRVSQLPEQYGCDVFWVTRGEKYGVQRKELGDLLSSVDDGRLGKELAQMRSAGVRGVLVIEGTPAFTTDGTLVRNHGRPWTVSQWYGVVFAAMQDCGVTQTRNLTETIRVVELYYAWSLKDRHGSLQGRPAPKGLWGSDPTNEDFAVHVLTAIPGIGPENARNIFKACGNKLPLTMSVDWATIEEIRGLGPKKVATLKKLFGSGE